MCAARASGSHTVVGETRAQGSARPKKGSGETGRGTPKFIACKNMGQAEEGGMYMMGGRGSE